MIFVLRNESMYLLSEKKIVAFQELLKANRYLSTYLDDFKRGYSFQLQIAFNLYTFLTTEQSELYTNVFFNFERPLHAYIHELLSRQYAFKKFKQLHSKNELLALIISVFITKKVIANIHQQIISQDARLMHENPLELIIPLADLSSSEEPPISLAIQTYLLKKMKELPMNFDYFERIVNNSIQSARELELLLRKEF